MNYINGRISIDLSNPYPQQTTIQCHELNYKSQFLRVGIYNNGEPVEIGDDCEITASFVIDGVLICD